MSGEFNIFKNLDDLRKTNLLSQLKNLESANASGANNSQEEELNDSFDIDALLNNNLVKDQTKRQKTKKESNCTPEKKSKAITKSRLSTTSSDGSLSPVMPLLDNFNNKVNEIPVGRRTRRSLEMAKDKAASAAAPSPKRLTEEEEFRQLYGEPLDHKGRGRSKKRDQGLWAGLGRGRGRKSIGSTPPQKSSASRMSENIQTVPSNPSSNDVSEQESEQPTVSVMERFLEIGRSGNRRSRRNNAMRARRYHIAEVAARSTVVDSIDLISSPWPRVEGMITLDSDTDEPPMATRSKKKNQNANSFTLNSCTSKDTEKLDVSYEDDNPELSVKINWKGKPEAFKLRKYQKFSIIFKELAERENTDIEKLVFNLNNRIILPDDTPDSIDYKVFQFITGRVLANRFNSPGAASAVSKKRDANKINLKIQSDKWKRPLKIDLLKTDKFRILFIKCSEELKVGTEQLKLSFDGEFLDINDTPADLDLEGGEVIDLRIKD